jgi:holo-[acyl-carrier protein] synthase
MTIFGIGVDVVDVERIEGAIARHGVSFLERIFTEAERAYCSGLSAPGPSYAVRFAAKEAVAKAFGTGIGGEAGLREIEIVREESGRPRIRLLGHAAEFAARHGISEVMVSLSHTRHSAVAQVVAVVG